MPTPKSRNSDGTLFLGFSFIVKMKMRRKDWQRLVVDRDKY
jgi:hypothetical protein